MENKLKAWAILDKETGSIARYHTGGEYMVSARKTPQSKLHETFTSIPCTITYEVT